MTNTMNIEGFFDEATSTISYIVLDSESMRCAVIDSVLDYDPKAGRTATPRRGPPDRPDQGARRDPGMDPRDPRPCRSPLRGTLSAGPARRQARHRRPHHHGPESLRQALQCRHRLRSRWQPVQPPLRRRRVIRHRHPGVPCNAHPRAYPACMTYIVSDATESAAFVGDTLFMPDYGTALRLSRRRRAYLYRSIRKVLSLPPQTRLYLCRLPSRWPRTRLRDDRCGAACQQRMCATASAKTNSPACATNGMRHWKCRCSSCRRCRSICGPVSLPPAEGNGVRYIKIPLNQL